jgi:hypothetical protein
MRLVTNDPTHGELTERVDTFAAALKAGIEEADGSTILQRQVDAVVEDIGHAIRTALGAPCQVTLDRHGELRVRFDAANTAAIAQLDTSPSVFPIDVIVEQRSTRCTDLAALKTAMVAALGNPAVAARIRNAAKRNGPALRVAPKSYTGVLTSGGVTA